MMRFDRVPQKRGFEKRSSYVHKISFDLQLNEWLQWMQEGESDVAFCLVCNSVRFDYRFAIPYTGHRKTRKVTRFHLIMILQWRHVISNLDDEKFS